MTKSNIGQISQIESLGVFDGPGLRFVVFMQGCKNRCLYCHNPETWQIKKGNIQKTPSQLLDQILKYKNYYGKDGGVTFSGGEPLLQPDFLVEILLLCKENNIHTCLDTSGVGENRIEEILQLVDLVIFDIKGNNEKEYEKITRNKMQQSKDFLNLCQKLNKKLWIRQVIVPNINDSEENIKELSQIIKPLKNVEKVELLPYQTLGISKYENLKIPYPLKNTPAMDTKKCKSLENKLLQLIKK